MNDLANQELFLKFKDGLIDRRTLLKGLVFMIGGASLSGCLSSFYKDLSISPPINSLQNKNIESVQNILFPESREAPSAEQINALDYLHFVLLDQYLDIRDRNFITNGANWLNETSLENFNLNFYQLSLTEREEILTLISKKSWGERWLSTILKYILEALLTDPIYGGNVNAIGWNWLGLEPGLPRPNKDNLYPKILKL